MQKAPRSVGKERYSPQPEPGRAHLPGMNSVPPWPRNRLLLALPAANLKRLLPQLQPIPCEREDILIDADSMLDAVYFPDSGVISVVAVYENGDIMEMANVGREGCTGFQALFGAEDSSVRFLVQIPGSAAKLPRAAFMRALKTMPAFRSLINCYVQAFLEQVLVSGACNGSHGVKERLARWLLMMRDRSDGDVLQITQTLLAEMLGVQRPTVTHALKAFQKEGLVAAGRRQVAVLDRDGLLGESCECYMAVRNRTSFYLPKTYD
jgi:CRP-like cAMP-binding protein